MEKMNNISPGLAKIVDAARPKPGQVIYFKSLRPNAGGTTFKGLDRIFDPYAANEDGSKGAFVDISYSTQVPAKGNNPSQYKIKNIDFKKSANNVIPISGNNRAGDSLFLFLFLTNYNKTNMGKEWYSPMDGQGMYFTMQEPAKSAKEKNESRRKLVMAFEKIDTMPDSKLLQFAQALEMPGINEFSKMEEIRDKLFLIAEGNPALNIKGNPDRVLNMDKDTNLNMKLFIKEALKYNIWTEDKSLRQFIWSDTQEPVFVIPPGSDLYNDTVKYLLGAGEKTHSLVKGLLDKAKSKEQKQKSYQPPTKEGSVGKAMGDDSNVGGKIMVAKEVVEVKE